MSDVTNFTVDGTVINVKDENAVSILANQGLTEQQKSNARSNIGAGDSSFSGSYNDLTDKPTIPVVNNATLTIQKNGTTVESFTANASANVTANIDVPTKVSQLTNDSGYTTNTGTVTQVKVGSTAYNPSSGVVSLPAYPTVNNATLTIQRNGTNVQTFTANQGSNATANITVPNWYHFQNKVTSTAINFPTGWKRAIVVLRDNATGYAATYTLSYDILNAVGNTTFVSGYFYTSADYMSAALICNSGGVIGKSVTKNGAVRAATDTTISVMISTI